MLVFKSSGGVKIRTALFSDPSFQEKVLCCKIIFVFFKLWIYQVGFIISALYIGYRTTRLSVCFIHSRVGVVFSLFGAAQRNVVAYNGCRFKSVRRC